MNEYIVKNPLYNNLWFLEVKSNMKTKEVIKCDVCNSSVSYQRDEGLYRCDNCGTITDSDGYVVYDNDDEKMH